MTAIIVYPSALEYWLEDRGISRSLFQNRWDSVHNTSELFYHSFSRVNILETLTALRFTAPVHIAVPRNANRSSSKEVVFHTLSSHSPSNSFLRISNEVYLSSPEMCFLQAAEYLNLPELVFLANQLCAGYYTDPWSTYGQTKREPVTTVTAIKNFLLSARGFRYTQKALQAIQYASDNANSPMEALLAVLAALPLQHGGYALPKFYLNLAINLSKEGCKLMGTNVLRGDFVWPEQRVIAEYDSKLVHLNTEQFLTDKNRSTAMIASGYTVIPITSNNVQSFSSIENLFLMIRKALKLNARPSRFNKYFEKRYEVVNNLMFGKEDSFRRRHR